MLAVLSLTATAYSAPRVTLEPEVRAYNASVSSWVVHSPAPRDTVIALTAVLTVESERRSALEVTLLAVSDPRSPDYGKHKSHAQIKEILAVPATRIARVRDFFKSHGAIAIEEAPTSDVLTVAMRVADVEKALATTLKTFSHTDASDVKIVRASSSYSLPAEVAKDLTMIGELVQFPRLRGHKLGLQSTVEDTTWDNGCKATGCAGKVTPAVIAKRYKLGGASNVVAAGNSMAVAEFQGQYYKAADLTTFADSCSVTGGVDTQVGTNEPIAGVEAELDIEYIKAVAGSVPLTVVYNSQYSLLSWATQITSLPSSPLVHSVSYGNDEAQQTSTAYMESANTAFMKAGTMGLSILFASGDQGVCGREGCGIFKTKYHPDFPAASPYITAVGGTDFAAKGVIGDEKAWNDGGGGFSDTFAIPSWQTDAVTAYKNNPDADLPDAKYWNNTGRGYPDIAALAGQQNPYCVAINGRFEGVAGTSAACPVAAGVFALLNGVRLAKGGSPLGFLNPFIYQNPSGFQDVSLGKITGGTKGGFTATKGWDAATGWGTPDYETLATLV